MMQLLSYLLLNPVPLQGSVGLISAPGNSQQTGLRAVAPVQAKLSWHKSNACKVPANKAILTEFICMNW